MNINLKNILGGSDPNTAIIFSKSSGPDSPMDIHRALIANGLVPLRGDYKKLPAIMSTMEAISLMVPKSTKVAIVIEDNDLDAASLEKIRQLVVDRSFSHWSLDNDARIIIISDNKPSMFRQALKGNAAFAGRPNHERSLTA